MSLGTVAGLLALAGMMMVDVMLNMWSFDGTVEHHHGPDGWIRGHARDEISERHLACPSARE